MYVAELSGQYPGRGNINRNARARDDHLILPVLKLTCL